MDTATESAQEHPDGRLLRLIRDSIVRPRRVAPPPGLFSLPPPLASADRSAVEALIRDRRHSQ
ncbi:MAG: hypothetical protein ACJ8AW_33735 [Rhodopila sp.]